MSARPEPSGRPARRGESGGALFQIGRLAGHAVGMAARLIDRAAERAAVLALDAKDAFDKELDPNIEDATILDETTDRGDA